MQTSLNKKLSRIQGAQVAGCRRPRDVRPLQEVYHFPCMEKAGFKTHEFNNDSPVRCSLLSPKGSFPSFF